MSATVVDAPEGLVHRNEVAAPAPSPPTAWCEECGYDLRGLSTGRPCPECGHVHASPRPVLRPDLLWNRSVAVGLALLLGVTVYATSSVLVQPFSGDFGGTLPALNVPGPKLWAVPLLQRPIGQNPQWPGVVGTRTALFSLLAVWLITAPRTEPEEGTGADSALGWVRPAARWASVVLFGLAFGVLLASQGIWPAELPPYRLVLASCEGAVLAPAGANELLGLASSLLPLGTAGIIAGLLPLNDQALVPLMVDLHGHLRAGQTLADSLYRVRCALKDDPVQHATATSLVALGAA